MNLFLRLFLCFSLYLSVAHSTTLSQALASRPQFSVVTAALKATKLVKALDSGTFTVFAPTDDAFLSLLRALGFRGSLKEGLPLLLKFLADPRTPKLSDVLLYHAVPGKQNSKAVLRKRTFETLFMKKTFTVRVKDLSIIDRAPKLPNAKLIPQLLDIRASNGIIHGIDGVLINVPVDPAAAKKLFQLIKIMSMKKKKKFLLSRVLSRRKEFAILAAALKVAKLDAALDSGTFTVFAPTNSAFIGLLKALGYKGPVKRGIKLLLKFLKRSDTPDPIKLLLYHVVSGKQNSAAVLKKRTFTTLSDKKTITVKNDLSIMDKAPKVPNAKLIKRLLNIKARNGIIHGIDGILFHVPVDPVAAKKLFQKFLRENRMKRKKTLSKVIASRREFIILNLLLKLTKLDKALDEGKFTVFAPTNLAFIKLLKALGFRGYLSEGLMLLLKFLKDPKTPDATKVLLYHVVAGSQDSAAVLKKREFMTLDGKKTIRVLDDLSIKDKAPKIPNAKLIKRLLNIKASNGIVHGIDGVLFNENVDLAMAKRLFKAIMKRHRKKYYYYYYQWW